MTFELERTLVVASSAIQSFVANGGFPGSVINGKTGVVEWGLPSTGGGVHVLDGASGSELWEVGNPEHGITDIAVGEADGEPNLEILFGAGFTSTGPDRLFVAGGDSHSLEWQSLDLRGPFLGIDFADLDADGSGELLTGCFESDSGYGDGLYLIRDAQTKDLEFISPQPTGLAWTGLWKAPDRITPGHPASTSTLTAALVGCCGEAPIWC